jgi:hypothetical protein
MGSVNLNAASSKFFPEISGGQPFVIGGTKSNNKKTNDKLLRINDSSAFDTIHNIHKKSASIDVTDIDSFRKKKNTSSRVNKKSVNPIFNAS